MNYASNASDIKFDPAKKGMVRAKRDYTPLNYCNTISGNVCLLLLLLDRPVCTLYLVGAMDIGLAWADWENGKNEPMFKL